LVFALRHVTPCAMKTLMVCVGVWVAVSSVPVHLAHADGGMDGSSALLDAAPSNADGLPSDLGPVSIEASRRAVQADITDWTDDKDRTHTARILACGLAGAEAGLLLFPVGSVAALGVVGDLEVYLTRDSQSATAPLNAALAELIGKVPFTAAEEANLQRLMNRPAQDVSDRIRLAIDTQSFLMKVSTRLFNEQIDEHFKRTEGFWGFFRADPEYCAAFSLVAQRDDQLIAAANQVLALYNSLEQELKD
jgi:hypothetical protein